MIFAARRVYEVRLSIAVVTDLDHRELIHRLGQDPQPTFVTDVVTDEVVSHLKSVAYVMTAVVTAL